LGGGRGCEQSLAALAAITAYMYGAVGRSSTAPRATDACRFSTPGNFFRRNNNILPAS
jgi:hypothetical protein